MSVWTRVSRYDTWRGAPPFTPVMFEVCAGHLASFQHDKRVAHLEVLNKEVVKDCCGRQHCSPCMFGDYDSFTYGDGG